MRTARSQVLAHDNLFIVLHEKLCLSRLFLLFHRNIVTEVTLDLNLLSGSEGRWSELYCAIFIVVLSKNRVGFLMFFVTVNVCIDKYNLIYERKVWVK